MSKIFRSKNFYFNHTYNKLYTSPSGHVGETAICLLLNTMLWKKYCWKTTKIIMTTIHSCFIAMVYMNLRQAYLLEVGLTQIPSAHAPSSTSCHVGRHVGFSSTNFFWVLQAFTSQCEGNLYGPRLFQPMRALPLPWSWAFNLVCEVALI